MNAEQCVPAQHFDVPVLDMEGLMERYGREVDGRLVIRMIRDREVGQSGNVGGRGLGEGRYRNGVCL